MSQYKILKLVLIGIFLVNLFAVVVPYGNVTSVEAVGGTVSGYEGTLWTGQLHNHAGEYGDDGTNTVEANLDYSLNSASPGLSFSGLSPHSHMVSTSNMISYWNDMQTRYTSGNFVPVPGQEWSTLSSSGHVNVYYGNEKCSVSNGDIPGFYSWLVTSSGYGSFNHPWSSDGNDMNNWQYYSSADKPGNNAGKMVMMEMKQSIGSTSGFADYPEALNNGWHIGISVSDDNHDGNIGNKYSDRPRTGMWLSSLTEAGVKEAFEELRFYASQIDEGYIDIKAGTYEMGDIAYSLSSSEYVYAMLNPSLSYSEVNLFYKSGSSYTTKSMSSIGSGEYRVTHDLSIDSWFFVRAKTSSGAYICSSPMWSEAGGSPGDTTAPAVSISSPSNGATVSGTTSISFSATDAVGVTSRAIKVDGSTVSTSSSYSWDTTAYSNGAHTIVCEASDAAGNTGSDSVSVTVSNTVSDDGGPLTDGVTANGFMDSADGADMWYIDVGANALSMEVILTCGSSDFDTFGKFGSEPTTSVYDWRGYTSGGEENTISNPAQGRHYIMVDYYSGSDAYQLTATITYDDTPPADTTDPTVSITAPSSGATVSGTTTISFSASDNVGVTSRAIYIGGSLVSSSTSYSWDTTAYSNGAYTINCQASDAAGNTGSDSISVTVSNTVSTGDMDTGADAYDSYSASDSATLLIAPISGTGELDLSTDQYDLYRVAVSSGDEVTITFTPPSGSTGLDVPIYDVTKSAFMTLSNVGSFTQTVTASGDGYVYWCLDADASSDTGTYSMSVSVASGTPADTTAPTVVITAPANGATVSGTTTVTFASTDNVGVTSRVIKIDGSTVSSSSSYSWDTTAYSNGAHTIVCEASDAAGNTGSSSISVTVSNSVSDDGGALTDGIGASGSMDSSDGSDMWYIDVSANAESMYVTLTCGSADFDTYGRFGSEPTTSTYDWRGYTSGGEENTVDSPAQGRHYIMVDYYSGSDAYTLTATITYGSSSGGSADQIVINEFLPDPNTVYTQEWIELYNPTSSAIDIGGCQLDDITGGGTGAYTIPAGTSVPANGFSVFYASTTGIALNNAGDTCNFLSSTGTVIDSHSYTSSSDDTSIGRDGDGSSTWTTFSSPTPGATNSGASTSGGSTTDGPPYTFTGTCGSDQYFDVYLHAGQTVQISLSWSGTTDLDWFLYRDSGTEVARGYTTSNPEAGTWSVDADGWYQIKVNKYDGVDVDFTLSVTYI